MVATETVGPFDGTPWAQDQWYRYAAAWAPSGVIDVPASSASAGGLGLTFSGLTPTVAAGRAWARGAGYELSGGSKTLAAVAANTNASLSRIDRLVLRRDLAAKTVTLTELQGTPASTPAPPALTQIETGVWDSPLFSFTVPPNSGTTISGITDERLWVDAAAGALSWPQAPVSLVGGWNTVSGHVPKLQRVGVDRVRVMGWVSNVVTYTPTGAEYVLSLGMTLASSQVFAVPWVIGGTWGFALCTFHTDGRLSTDKNSVNGSIPSGANFFLDGIELSLTYQG